MREFQNKVDVKVSISCIIKLPLKEAVWNVRWRGRRVESRALRRFIFLFDSIGRMSPGEEKKRLKMS